MQVALARIACWRPHEMWCRCTSGAYFLKVSYSWLCWIPSFNLLQKSVFALPTLRLNMFPPHWGVTSQWEDLRRGYRLENDLHLMKRRRRRNSLANPVPNMSDHAPQRSWQGKNKRNPENNRLRHPWLIWWQEFLSPPLLLFSGHIQTRAVFYLRGGIPSTVYMPHLLCLYSIRELSMNAPRFCHEFVNEASLLPTGSATEPHWPRYPMISSLGEQSGRWKTDIRLVALSRGYASSVHLCLLLRR